jgi:hypothetical protein
MIMLTIHSTVLVVALRDRFVDFEAFEIVKGNYLTIGQQETVDKIWDLCSVQSHGQYLAELRDVSIDAAGSLGVTLVMPYKTSRVDTAPS